MIIQFELTDTYAGESNYSWVKRHKINLPDNKSDLAIIRMAKKWCGMNGVRARIENYGDMISIKPFGACVVLFITWGE